MRLVITLVALLTFAISSCSNRQTAKFEVTNSTPFVIDSLYFQPSAAESRTYFSLQPQQTKMYYLDMSRVTTDGTYGIFFKSNEGYRGQAFGYFSNGIVMEDVTKVQITKDTILIKAIYSTY